MRVLRWHNAGPFAATRSSSCLATPHPAPCRTTCFVTPKVPLNRGLCNERDQPSHRRLFTPPIGHATSPPVLMLGDRLTVGQRTLTPFIVVRIHVPQPTTRNGWVFIRE